MSILDAIVSVGVETTYGTPVAPTRSFEAKADPIKTLREPLESAGIRAGMTTLRSDRRRQINMGGEGTIEVDLFTKGMGMLLKGLLGGAAGPTQQAATPAYLQTYTATADGPAQSWTIQAVRPFVNTDAVQAFTAHGCMATGWKLAQEVGSLPTLEIDFDAEDVDTSTAAAAATYVAGAVPFDWTQVAVTLNGSALDNVTGIELEADLKMKTDRRYLRGSTLKRQPVRGGRPEYTGTLTADFDALARYNEWTAGSVIPNLIITWTGAVISGAYSEMLKVTIPFIQWDGDDPQMSTDEVTTQELPFTVLDGGAAPITIEYQSTDTAI